MGKPGQDALRLEMPGCFSAEPATGIAPESTHRDRGEPAPRMSCRTVLSCHPEPGNFPERV